MRALLRDTPKKTWLMGCSTAVIGFAITTAILFYIKYKEMDNYILDHQVPVPTVSYTRAESETLRRVAEDFVDGVDEGKDETEITLTVKELNQLLQSQPELAEWGTRVYVVSIDADEIVIQVSVPFEAMDVPEPRLRGKYLTGNLHVIAGLHNERVKLHFLRFERDGKEAPFIEGPIGQILDIDKWRENDPKLDALLYRVRALELQEGKIHAVVGPKPTN